MEKPLCEMRNISKTANDIILLDNVDICLYKGEIHSIIGDNGAGKSMLMNVLAGLEDYQNGSIFFENQLVIKQDTLSAAKRGITMIHQEISLVAEMSVFDNIFLGNYAFHPYIRTIDKENSKKLAKHYLDMLKFNIDLDKKCKMLGSTQKKMVEIVRALCKKFKILILDNACRGLSESERASFYDELVKVKELGVGIFYISNRVNDIVSISDKVTKMDSGRVVFTYSRDEISSNDLINKIMINGKKGYPKKLPSTKVEVLKVVKMKNKTVLNDISFSLYKGEILGIIGATGSGRTAISKCMFGLDASFEGDIYINNKNANIKCPKDAIRHSIGYVQENKNDDLVPNLTPIKNITLANMKGVCDTQLIDGKLEKKSASYFLDKLGLDNNKRELKTSDLSVGEKQKISISKWLFSGSKILLFDEPTEDLDSASRIEFFNLLRVLANKEISIVMFSSNIDELVGVTNRTLLLKNGKITDEFKAESLTVENIMFSMINGS